MQTYMRTTYEDRVRIETLRQEGHTYGEIGEKLGKSKSSIWREYKRFPFVYRATRAHYQSRIKVGNRSKGCKMDNNPRLFKFVKDHLNMKWSPDQISKELKKLYPEDKSMQISHESIYTYIYLLPRGELKKELIKGLRQKKKSRYNRKGVYDKRGSIKDMISIEERPEEVAHRSVAGHWEGDLLIGKGHKSALGTIVERKTRTVILVPLKARDPFTVREAFEKELKTLPRQVLKSMTYDQGKEMAEHKLFAKNMRMKVYFCHPSSPWERGTCENTNMLIRGFFPKGTDFNAITRSEIKRVQKMLNERPRRALEYRKPFEVFQEEVLQYSK